MAGKRYDEAREYLDQHSHLTAKIRRIEEAIEEARSVAEYPGISLTGMPRAATPRNATEDKLVRLVSLEEELLQAILKDKQKIYEIENTINAIDNQDAAQVLHLRYIMGMPFEAAYGDTIASVTHYSLPRTYSLHREGLNEVQEIIKKTN